MKVWMGVDIGKNGAYCIIRESGDIDSGKLPWIENEGLDIFRMKEILSPYLREGDQLFCVTEDLKSIFGTSAASNFSYGYTNGELITFLRMMEVPFMRVNPKVWQKFCWQGISIIQINTGKKDKKGNPKYKTDTKSTSLLAARRLFPKETFLASERSKVPHDGIVDAFCIAFFAKSHY